MKEYKIIDINKSLLSSDKIIKAKSPKQAAILAGYKNIKRDASGHYGHIVVTGKCGSYVYFGEV